MLVLASQLSFSQGIKVVKNEQIPIPESGKYFPVLSPTGEYLIVSGNDMQGLQKYDLDTKQLTTLTKGKSAGFGAQISSDGSTVIFRTSKYKDRLRYSTLHSVNVQTGKETALVKDTRDLQGVSVVQGTVLAVNNGKILQKRVSGNKLAVTPPVTSIKDGQLYVTQNGQTKQISPAGTGSSYLWSSVSPDGKKLLYYVINHAKAYVSNIDGSNPVSLGVLRAPSWLGNNWVVGMLDRDNGEIITSSKIIAVAADGTQRTQLTNDSVIALNPSTSTDATKIAYNTADGKVFLMQVETNK